MKKVKLIGMLICLFAMGLAQPSGTDLLNAVEKIMNPEHSKGIMKQTINTTSGEQHTLEYETFSGFYGEFSLMKYLAPSRVKGNAMLTSDFSDNIWMYNSRTNRVRKLASHAKKQKFEGSDFTYEDMGSGSVWVDNYIPENIGKTVINETECYELVLTRIPDYDGSYSKITIWCRVSDNYPIQVDYYENDIHTKSCFLTDIRMIEGISTAMCMTMKNLGDNTSTIMEYISLTYDVSFDKNFFSERNLTR